MAYSALLLLTMTIRLFVSLSLRTHIHLRRPCRAPQLSAKSSTSAHSDSNKGLYPRFSFNVLSKASTSNARTGLISTPHGTIQTPNFVFCATKAVLKTLTPQQLREANSQVILSNTYHLMLSPGSELVHNMGGLQRFTGWNGPMMTDSGGYQIFAMGHGSVSKEIKGNRSHAGWDPTLLKIDEVGATFKSYVDNSTHTLTPEKSIEIQKQLGADIILVLDECTPFNIDREYTEMSMLRSHRWARRSLNMFRRVSNNMQALYGIIQGGVYEDLRTESVEFANNEDFFGIAIGGSLGATKRDMHGIVAFTRALIRNDRPVHLLGIGGVRDIFHGVRQGIDTFDCVHPTRIARHYGALVPAAVWYEEANKVDVSDMPHYANALRKLEEKMRISRRDYQNKVETAKRLGLPAPPLPPKLANPPKLKHYGPKENSKKVVREHMDLNKLPMRTDSRPIDSSCSCYTCKNFSRAYIYHLIKIKETNAGTLITIHNVHFMNRLMADIRRGIETDTLDEVEKYYVHPELAASLLDESNESKGISE